jgi:hypothetical protein
LVKGKPWDLEDEKKLIDWYNSGTTSLRVLAFSFEGKYSENAIYQKLLDLGLLEEEEDAKKTHSSSSTTVICKFELPKELPSIEETLKTLAAALKSLETQGLEKNDVLRLRCIIVGAKVYKELLSDYINYRGLEDELLELKEKYAELSKKTQGIPPK